MTLLDAAIVGVLALSILFAYARGIVRSLIGFVAWIAGLVAGFLFAPALAQLLPAVPDHPLVPQAVAFVLIFVSAIVAGALLAWPLRAVVHGAGLGFLDRGLGAVFGLARGALVLAVFAVAVGLSALPQRDWWQNSLFAPTLEAAALSLRPWLPPAWAAKLAYPERSARVAPVKA
ncbi:MAG TPA: CvpA family protein [Casimicrobiaceae bacterium]|nr:CvpA family protein [Casimicrobiaceae bacterium]